MTNDHRTAEPTRRPIAALLNEVKVAAVRKLFARLQEEGFEHIREGHGCVFGFIDIEHGSRLTELAERAGLTKQAVGEAATELERLGYVERVPDPTDGRAKIIKLTDRGMEAVIKGRRIFAEIEREWAEQIGAGADGELPRGGRADRRPRGREAARRPAAQPRRLGRDRLRM